MLKELLWFLAGALAVLAAIRFARDDGWVGYMTAVTAVCSAMAAWRLP